MRVLAIYTGRHHQNSEYYAKTALRGAIEAGAEVELVNLRDLNLKPCTGCCACHMSNNGCNIKDDIEWLDERYLECDGLIVVAPCYENSPPSELKLWCDRHGPSHDIMMQKMKHERLLAEGKPGLDPRWFKHRPVAYIAHGGSDWTTLGLPVLGIISVPLGLTIVDQLKFSFDMFAIHDEHTAPRVALLGKNVADNCNKPREKMVYSGDPGHCPMCHNTTMVLGDNADDVVCAVCGMRGTLSVIEGKIRMEYPADQFEMSHVTDAGKIAHMRAISGKGVVMHQSSEDYEATVARIKEGNRDDIVCSKPSKLP